MDKLGGGDSKSEREKPDAHENSFWLEGRAPARDC
jgi:hypothetical protein